VGDDVPPRVRLIDFGVAAFPTRDPGVNAKYEAWGTPHFMAPEQAFGEPELDPDGECRSRAVPWRVPFCVACRHVPRITTRAVPSHALPARSSSLVARRST